MDGTSPVRKYASLMKSKIPLARKVNREIYGISVGSHGYHCLVPGLDFNFDLPPQRGFSAPSHAVGGGLLAMLYHALRGVKCDHFQVYTGFATTGTISLLQDQMDDLAIVGIQNPIGSIFNCLC